MKSIQGRVNTVSLFSLIVWFCFRLPLRPLTCVKQSHLIGQVWVHIEESICCCVHNCLPRQNWLASVVTCEFKKSDFSFPFETNKGYMKHKQINGWRYWWMLKGLFYLFIWQSYNTTHYIFSLNYFIYLFHWYCMPYSRIIY